MSVKLTPAFLKKVYESGEPITNKRQKLIAKQLVRVCGYKPCEVSLAFERAGKEYCTTNHSSMEKNRVKSYNKKKKAEYNKRHGITRKTVRRNVKVSKGTNYIEYDPSITLIYEDYKEPLRTVESEKGKGFGYMGTVALSEDRNHIQCHICGNLFQSLGGHLRNHKTTARDYKKEYGLAVQTALMGEETRKKFQENVIAKSGMKGKGLPKHLEGYNAKFKSGELKRKRQGDYSLEWRNKRGLCPDQVLEKILDLKEKLGKTPGIDDFKAEYKGRYLGSIVYQHGSWSNAISKLGLQTREELRRHSQEELIQELQDFQERHGRIPMTSDFNRGLLTNKGTYIRKFGTLNNARVAAGMNAILAMPFGQHVELTAEQYEAYMDGRGTPGKTRAERRKVTEKRKGLLARLGVTT